MTGPDEQCTEREHEIRLAGAQEEYRRSGTEESHGMCSYQPADSRTTQCEHCGEMWDWSL